MHDISSPLPYHVIRTTIGLAVTVPIEVREGCWGFYFTDPNNEALFLESFFHSNIYMMFSITFAVLQLIAFIYFLSAWTIASFLHKQSSVAMIIGSGVDGGLILMTHILKRACWKRLNTPLWSNARSIIGVVAACSFFIGGLITVWGDISSNEGQVANCTIGDSVFTSHDFTSSDMSVVSDDSDSQDVSAALYNLVWKDKTSDLIVPGWKFRDYIFITTGPQTLFLHSLPAIIGVPVMLIQLITIFSVFFPANGASVLFIYICFYQICFALTLALVTGIAEWESRRKFKEDLLKRSRRKTSDTIIENPTDATDVAMDPTNGNHAIIPVYGTNTKVRTFAPGFANKDDLGKQIPHDKDMESFRIPSQEIEESGRQVGHGAEVSVFKGTWNASTGMGMDIAIKKYGAHDNEFAKFQNEVRMLMGLDHR